MYKRDCGMLVIDVQWRLVIRHYYIINETVQAKLINRKSVMKECKFNLFYDHIVCRNVLKNNNLTSDVTSVI